MLRLVEYGLLAVSLLTVLGLIMAAPSAPAPEPTEVVEPETRQIGN
jgi:hypothetical protein